MRNSGIWPLLVLTIFVVAALPLGAAFYFLDHALQTSLDLGFNDSILGALQAGADDLKTLRRLDPANQEQYREQFQSVERLRRVYSNPQLLKASLIDSLKIYFALGFLAAVLLAVLLAGVLSRRINRSYNATIDELLRHRERVRYLEAMASWQDLARMLAHEIKNPLTPIEVLVSSLSRSHQNLPEREFREQLQRTQTMVGEELAHLKTTVGKFSEFAALPAVQLVDEDVAGLCGSLVQTLRVAFDRADIEVCGPNPPMQLRAKIDASSFRQVFTNIIRNGLEANQDRRVRFTIRMSGRDGWVDIALSNDGNPVPGAIAERIFDPYMSSHSGKENMGLGLAIVKKIILEHGGEIGYAEVSGRPVFTLSVPQVA
jgi:signal transduction histidine kinase